MWTSKRDPISYNILCPNITCDPLFLYPRNYDSKYTKPTTEREEKVIWNIIKDIDIENIDDGVIRKCNTVYLVVYLISSFGYLWLLICTENIFWYCWTSLGC